MTHEPDCPAAYGCCPIGDDRDCALHIPPACNCGADDHDQEAAHP